MKRIIMSLTFILLTYSSVFSAQVNPAVPIISKNKIIITSLHNLTRINPDNYQFFSSSLARSIKNTISKNVPADFIQDLPEDALLVQQGYNYRVLGSYKITGDEINVAFSVTHTGRKITTIIANVSGYADNRVFDLIDKISARVAETVAKPLPAVITTATVININREGKITTRQEVLNNMDLRGKSFYRRDLHGRDLSNSNFTGSNFERANLSSANLSNSNFTIAEMEGADLRNCNARGAIFTNADMRGTELRGANLAGARFENTHFGNIDLRRDSPEFRDAILINPLFDKLDLYLIFTVNAGMNIYDKSAYAVNANYSNVSGKKADAARGLTVELLYFFNENWGIKFSTGWRGIAINVDETGLDSLGNPLALNMHNTASYLIFELDAVLRLKRFLFFAGFYTGVLLKFSGNMKVQYTTDNSSPYIDVDNSYGNKALFGFSFGSGYTLRLSRFLSLLFSLNIQFDITKWYSDTALNTFSHTQPVSNGGSALKNLRQTCILFRVSLLWGLK